MSGIGAALPRAQGGGTKRPHRGTVAAGVLFFLLGAWFLTAIMLGASIAPIYDYSSAAISDLGVIPETAVLFNLTLALIGGLNLVGGYLFHRSHRHVLVFSAFAIASAGAIGAGLFPLSTGDVHSLFALFAFVFFNVEAVACAAVLSGWMRILSAVSGLIGLTFTVLMVVGDSGTPAAFWIIGHGGTERMIAYPVMLWLTLLGGYLIAGNQPATANAGRHGPG
jgi:hypothetical membrane protein